MNSPSWLDRQAWPFAPRWAETTDGLLHYVDEGSGTPVVLVHGTPTWSFEWRHVIAGRRSGQRMLALDHLGFWRSDRPPGASYRPEDQARRFREWVERVVPSGPIDLVVHDFGGPIALDWALDHGDRLRSVTVLNSWMWSFADDAAMRRKARLAGSALGRFLYRRFNASQRLIMPSAYGDRRKDRFASFACGGIAVYFLTHIVINLAMVCGLFPVVGIPLPFVSYGGSSMLTKMLALGVTANLSRSRFTFQGAGGKRPGIGS